MGGATWSTWSKLVGSTDVILNGTSQQSSSNFNISGTGTVTKLSIGANISTFSSLMIGKTITGSANAFGVRQEGAAQTDVSNAYGFYNLGTVASGHALGDYNHYAASQNTIPVGSTISRQLGFRAASNFTGATSNYGFYGEVPLNGSANWNVYMTGNAPNYFRGNVGIGSLSVSATSLRISSTITGGVNAYGVLQEGIVQSDVTTQGIGYYNNFGTVAAVFTLPSYSHFYANQGTIGAGSVVTNQIGFRVGPNLTGATNNYGYYGAIPSGTSNWNLYMIGTAPNYLAGRLGLNSQGLTNVTVRNGLAISGSVSSYGHFFDGIIQSDVTTLAAIYSSNPTTQAASFTLTTLNHFQAVQNTIGAGSSITHQIGFYVGAGLTGATNNYAFKSDIDAGAGRWNGYFGGTAQNYFAGNVGIGVVTPSTALHLASGKVIRLAGLTSSLLKTNSNGDIVAAIAGVDYITTVPNNGALTLSTTGILSGSATFTADQSGNSTFTVNAPNYGTTSGTIAQGNDSRFHNAVTLGSANGLSLSTQVLSLALASTSATGALSSTDWNTFNGKAPATGSANYIQNQYTSGQTADIWINGIVRANCYVADGYGYTIAAQSDYYGFFTDSSFSTALPIKAKSLVLSASYSTTAPANGLYVEGGVKLNTLAGTGLRMVTADASGNLSFDVIPTGVDQWSTNGYNYLSANSINNGAGNGIHTGGGFASSTHLITGDYTLADNIHTVVRLNAGGTFKLYMPNPADFEDREIQIRNATHGSQSPVLIQSYPIYYFANNSSSSNNQVIQVNGDSTTGGVEYYTAVTIKSVRCVINSVDSYYWIVINKI